MGKMRLPFKEGLIVALLVHGAMMQIMIVLSFYFFIYIFISLSYFVATNTIIIFEMCHIAFVL